MGGRTTIDANGNSGSVGGRTMAAGQTGPLATEGADVYIDRTEDRRSLSRHLLAA